jgi:hypothetical protein
MVGIEETVGDSSKVLANEAEYGNKLIVIRGPR